MFMRESLINQNNDKGWFLFLSAYLAVDLARIQDCVPGLSNIKPGLILTLVVIFYLLLSKRFAFAYSAGKPQLRLILAFVCLLFLYIPFASGARAAYNAALGMLLFVPYIMSSVVVVNSKGRFVLLCKVYIFILFFLGSYGLLHGGRGPGGSVADENDLGLFLVTFLPFAFLLLSQGKKIVFKLLLLVIVLVVLAAVIATNSRGSLVGLAVMFSVYWWFSRRKIIILLCVACFVLGVSNYGEDAYKKKMSTITDTNESSAQERLLSWKAASSMFINSPLGVGGNNFGRHFQEYQPEELQRGMWGRAAHSLWFTLIPETGVIGIVLYLSIIYFNLKNIIIIRKHRWPDENKDDRLFFETICITLLAAFFGFFAAASFLSVLYYPIFWYLTSLVICIRNIFADTTDVATV